MKKKLGLGLLSVVALIGLASCGDTKKEETPTPTPSDTKPVEVETMTYSEFMAAEAGDNVKIEGHISAKQSWWNNAATIYLVGDKGEGYFVYNCPMTQEEYNTKYTIGTAVSVKSVKVIYKGEHEINGESYDVEIDTVANASAYHAVPVDLTSSVKSTDLEAYQNALFSATLTVKQYTTTDTEHTGVGASGAFGYEKTEGDAIAKDLYITLVDSNNNELNACVESYLTGTSSDVYSYVRDSLQVGDLVKVTGFLYFWNGANPHIVSITPQVDTEYETFMASEVGDDVEVTGKIYAKQSFWDGKATCYVSSTSVGEGYVVYELPCTQEQYDTDLAIGNVIKITGTKANYAGLDEISRATYQVVTTGLEKYNIAEQSLKDVQYAGVYMGGKFTGTYTILEYNKGTEDSTVADSKAYAYKGATPTSDLYLQLKAENGMVLAVCVQGYLAASEYNTNYSSLNTIVKDLAVGEKITITGAMYWWNGANPHVLSITKVTQ